MRRTAFFALCLICLLLLCACGEGGNGFYVIQSENNQNSTMPYVCTYENEFDKETRTLTFSQIDSDGEIMGYGKATYDEKGRRLTYLLKDGNQNTYLSQEFTYDDAGNLTQVYTRMLGNPDCMEYKNYEDGRLIGGMLCYYDESGDIESTELYRIENVEQGSVITYYDTDGSVIAASGYKESFDEHGNLLSSVTYADGGFTQTVGRVEYTYEWIDLD